MNTRLLRSVFSIAELLLGLALAALGAYSLWSMQDCPQTVDDCVGWRVLGGALFLPPGLLVAVAGALSHFVRRIPLVLIQVLLIAALFGYFYLMGFK